MSHLDLQGLYSNRCLSPCASTNSSRSLCTSPSRSLCTSPSRSLCTSPTPSLCTSPSRSLCTSPSRSLCTSPSFTFSQDAEYTNSRMFSNDVCHHLIAHTKHPDTAHKNDGEPEFAVAADLTLYANPLRCLKKTSKPTVAHATSGDNMVAADLVKYGSPLDH